jgi:hypothetical protein
MYGTLTKLLQRILHNQESVPTCSIILHVIEFVFYLQLISLHVEKTSDITWTILICSLLLLSGFVL